MQLIIQSFGASLHKKAGAFEIHKKGERTKVSPLKVKSIALSRGARISSDAVLMAIEHEIEILFIDRSGDPKGRVWSHRYGSISTIRRQQLAFFEKKQALLWLINEIVAPKMDSQSAFLQSLLRDRPAKNELIEHTIANIGTYVQKVQGMKLTAHDTEIKATLRGLEGNASRSYFQCLGKVVPKLYQFETRSRRPAQDMFNSVLNYLYGILYSRVEGAIVKAGMDPYLGILHRDDYNRPVLVFDMIEKYRIWADQVAMQLCFRRLLQREMFEVENEGYWLADSGKKIVIPAMNDYLETVIQKDGKRRSRAVHLQEDMHHVAQYLLKHGGKE